MFMSLSEDVEEKVPWSQETFKCDGWLFCIKRVVRMTAVLWMSAELAYWSEPTVSGNWVVIRIPFPLSSSFSLWQKSYPLVTQWEFCCWAAQKM